MFEIVLFITYLHPFVNINYLSLHQYLGADGISSDSKLLDMLYGRDYYHKLTFYYRQRNELQDRLLFIRSFI